MSFTRSQSGIRNSALFFGVDRTVYVEGTGTDQRYWQTVFSALYKGPLRFHFKSVGPRTAVLPYIKEIANGNSLSVVAIVDSDYEGLKFSKLDIPNIIYTFGYSFENDLFTTKQAIKLISQFAHGTGNGRFREIIKRLKLASDELSKLAVLDFIAQFNGGCLLQKNGNTCKLNIKNNSLGVICKKSIEAVRSDAINRGVRFTVRPSRIMRAKIVSNPNYRWIYGHLWRATFVKCVADELRKKYSVSLNPDAIENLAISNVGDSKGKIFTGKQIAAYKSMISSLK